MNREPPHSLAQLQQWLYAVITEPQGVQAGLDSESARTQIDVASSAIESVVPASDQLDPVSKIKVYGNAYFARLIECLGEEFPAVKAAVGEETFGSFAFSYLQQYPSRSYTLGKLGKEFPGFLAETKPDTTDELGWADFLIDLARLEWHYSEIFSGPGTESVSPLQPADLQQLTPEEFAGSRLIPAPCLRTDSFRFPVHEYATAVRKRQESPSLPPPQPTWLIMTRRQYVVRRVSVEEGEYAVLKELLSADGLPVGEILDRASGKWADAMRTSLESWFERWTAAGYFIGLEPA